MTPPSTATFRKEERLCGKTSVSALLDSGRWGSTAHFKYCWAVTREEGPVRVLISVPKKFFKRAVKRNLVKRLVREAYRRNKQVLIDTLQTVEQRKTLSLCFIWTDHNLRSYEEVERKTANLLQRIAEKIGKDMAEEAENAEQ